MSLLEAIVLGVVQGVTEFLPISSTAHLRILPELLGWKDPGAAYSAVIQLGTVAAVVLYFAKDLVRIFSAALQGIFKKKPFETQDARLGFYVLLGTVPVGIFGLLLKKHIETSFRSLYVVSASLIILAVVLWWAERTAKHQRALQDMTFQDAMWVGLWQALALIPGSSRSGTTLTGGLFLGLRREDAARFSFLLSVPATALAGFFELKHLLQAPERPGLSLLVVGTVVSFVSGMAAIEVLLRFLRTRTTLVFVLYRLALGACLLTLLATGMLKPHAGI